VLESYNAPAPGAGSGFVDTAVAGVVTKALTMRQLVSSA